MLGQQEQEFAALEQSEMAFVHQLTDVDELRIISDPRRWAIHSHLIQRELTVKELAERIAEPQKRLYHHVKELERVGLIRVTRTELKSGIVQKHYRATSRWLDVSPALMHLPAASPEVSAALDWYLNLLRMTASNLREAISADPRIIGSDIFWTSFNGIRLAPERARDLSQRLAELHAEFIDNAPPIADGEPFERISLTIMLLPRPPRTAGQAGTTDDDAHDITPEEGRAPTQ